MGIILDKLFGGGAPVVESKLDTAGAWERRDTRRLLTQERPSFNKMGIVLDKLFGPGAAPLVEVDSQGACSSQCCEDVEVVSSSSSSSSEPLTHASGHATDSWSTVPERAEEIAKPSGPQIQSLRL